MQSLSLTQLALDHLDAARGAASGRSAVTIYGGHEHQLRQTLIALTADQALGEHESPGEATLQVITGQVRLSTSTDSWTGSTGEFLVVPPERHDLHALTDAVVLLTVALRASE
ncbi:cupin domain-containing protein [Nocardioides sp. GXZ039]|uniref:cupin domain-containing protein n=1 Tax=Nocardioides sp. GXZ039 TaxID=3136018 RepID=UPI0030F44196